MERFDVQSRGDGETRPRQRLKTIGERFLSKAIRSIIDTDKPFVINTGVDTGSSGLL
jgi:hypothetical protein